MVKIKKIVVDGIVVIEWEMTIWDKSDFVVRFGKDREVQFHVDRVFEDEAHCTVISGEEVLPKVQAA